MEPKTENKLEELNLSTFYPKFKTGVSGVLSPQYLLAKALSTVCDDKKSSMTTDERKKLCVSLVMKYATEEIKDDETIFNVMYYIKNYAYDTIGVDVDISKGAYGKLRHI